MPRGGPRGSMRGGAPRGGLGRGSAPRGAPSGRGGPPAAANRGGSAPRSRPPTAGAPRMLPSAAMSHQQGPGSASQPKADAYEDYVSCLSPGVVVIISCWMQTLFGTLVVTHSTLTNCSFHLLSFQSSYEEAYAEPAYEGYDGYYSQQSAPA